MSDIRNIETEDQLFDDTILNDEISLGETLASLQYLKSGKAAGPDKVFTRVVKSCQIRHPEVQIRYPDTSEGSRRIASYI